jgi:diguanylate cyclase (GGDEF)-like protein/putative nucleotidyltransferase with HDIG domain
MPKASTFRELPRDAALFLIAVTAAGLLIDALALWNWRGIGSERFLTYLAISCLAAGLKVRLPGIKGTMSVSFLFILMGIAQLTLAGALIIGVSGALIQSLWKAKECPRYHQIAFNVGAISASIAAAQWSYEQLSFGLEEGSLLRLMTAAGVYFLFNTFLVASILGLVEDKPIAPLWKESYFWTFPYYLVGAFLAAAHALLAEYIGWQSALAVLPIAFVIYRSYSLYVSRLEEAMEHANDMAGLHLRTIEALAMAIEAKDTTTHDHLQRVQTYALEIAKELKLTEDETHALQAAGLLHDIGKLAIPEHIISKPGKLTREEFEKIKTHPVVGADILERVQFPYPVVPIVRHHHEKWNGAGYPDGLCREDIPIGARILSAVDCFDALASDRQYRRALPLDEAMAFIKEQAGTSFDPKVVEVLERRYRELEVEVRGKVASMKKLDLDVQVARGKAPDAGFAAVSETKTAGEETSCSPDLVNLIANASAEAQGLYEAARDLGSSLSLEETLSVLVTRLRLLAPWDGAAVYLLRDEALHPAYVAGEDFHLFSSLKIPLGEGLSGWVASNSKAIVNGNPSVEAGYLNEPAKFSFLQSALSVPLEGAQGVVGVLTLYRREKDAFTRDHLRILTALATKAALCVENALKHSRANQLAAMDDVTGLPNARSLFLHLDRELARARREGTPLAVVVLDLDNFEQINGAQGHRKGDAVLNSVGASLKDCCREYDYAARMGGDEFVLIMPGMDESSLSKRKDKLYRLPADAAPLEDLGLSIGAAFFPADGEDAEQLLAEADRRMFREKQAHREARAIVAGAAAKSHAVVH